MLLLTMIAAYAGGIVLVGNQANIFDRYMLPLIPAVAAVLVIEPGHRWPAQHRPLRAIPCFLLLAASALFAVPATHDFLAWNRARWAATDSLRQAGVAFDGIDGGYEFNGWHAYVPTYRVKTGQGDWLFYDTEYVIASGPINGYGEVGRFGFERWLGPSQGSVLVLHRLNR